MENLKNEIEIKGLYNAIEVRSQRILEECRGLPYKSYKEVTESLTQILELVKIAR